jgi:hypothetical protein
MSQSCETTRVPGFNCASRRWRSARLTWTTGTGEHRGLADVGVEQIAREKERALGDAGLARRRDALLDQAGIELDTEAARAQSLRGGDDDAPVTRTEIDQEIVRAHPGQLEHFVDHHLRGADIGDFFALRTLRARACGEQRAQRERKQPAPPHARYAPFLPRGMGLPLSRHSTALWKPCCSA